MKLVFYSYPKTPSDIRSNVRCDNQKFLFRELNMALYYKNLMIFYGVVIDRHCDLTVESLGREAGGKRPCHACAHEPLFIMRPG